MKKTFTILIAAIAAILMMAQPMKVWANEDGYTATSGDKPEAVNGTTTGNVTGTNSIIWSYSVTQETKSGKTPYVAYSDASGWQIGSGNSPCTAFSISTSDISGTITKIVVSSSSKSASSKINATVGGNAFGTQNQATGSGGTLATQTFEGSASGEIIVSATASSAAFYFKTVTITYTPTGATETTTTITVPLGFITDVYQQTTNAGTLTATVSANNIPISNATVTWSSSNTNVATVGETTGVVTLVAAGSTTITANYAGATGLYAASSATQAFTITDSTPFAGGDVTFDAGTDVGTTTTTGPDSMTKAVVTVSSTSAAFATAEYRIYSGSTTTILTSEGTITQIVFTGNDTKNPVSNLSTEIGSFSVTDNVGTWTGNATSIEFAASAQARASQIVVTVNTSGTPDPVINAQNVSIDYNATGGNITYTIDNEPATPGTLTATFVAGYTIANLNIGSPANGSITFTCGANTETTSHTATVTLAYNYGNNEQVTKTITITQAAAPASYTTISALFEASTSTATEVFVTFGGWVVSGVSTNGYNVFVTDGTNGFVINGSEHGFVVGNTLTSTTPIACTLQKSNGYAKVTGINASTANLTVGTGGTVTPASIAMADLVGVNTGALVSYQNLTCSIVTTTNNNNTYTNYNLSDGITTIQAYKSLYDDAYSNFEDGKTYNITGVYQQYNSTKEILPRSAADIVEVAPATVSYYYSINGVVGQANTCTVGSTKTLNEGTDLDSNFTFAGWTTDANDVSQRLTEYTFPNDTPVIFYAVYAHTTPAVGGSSSKDGESYTKITSTTDLSNGDYLIVLKDYDSDLNYIPYIFNGLSSANEYETSTFSSEGVITDVPDGAAVVTISAITDGYSIKISANTTNNINKYIGGTSGSNVMNFSDNELLNTISFDSDGNVDIASNTSHLRWNAQNSMFRYYKSSSYSGQTDIQLYKKSGSGPVFNTNYYTRVLNETATADITIIGPSIIPSFGLLDMATYNLERDKTLSTLPYLLIEEGGQLICPEDTEIRVRYQKSITAPSGTWGQNDNTGWYAVSSPIGSYSKTSEIENFEYLVNDVRRFDFFAYGEKCGWYNKIDADNYVTKVKAGYGYLYAREVSTMVAFADDADFDDHDLTNLSYTSSRGNLAGLHCIGNPYTHNIYKGVGITGDMAANYYALNEATGAWISTTDATPIVPTQAILVFVNKTDGTAAIHMTSDNSAPSSKANNDYIQFTVSNNQYEDVAYAWFDNIEGLNKINHRNSEVPMIYIPQGDMNCSIAPMADNTQSFNLNFKAMTTGKYTLSYKTQGEFNYMHIYDRLTGEDVDMLLEGEYSFIGSQSDNDARFIVRLGYTPNYDGDDNFVYQNGNDLIVNGEGELQIFDVMGRMVKNTVINGVETIAMPQGVYVCKLNGNVQKIVVR